MLKKFVDFVATGVVTLGAPLFRTVGNWPADYPLYLRQADRVGVQWLSTHYYHPTYANRDLPKDVTGPRDLPGLDLHEQSQLDLLNSFGVQDELAMLAHDPDPELGFRYENGQYGPGDADSLYAMVRLKKPKRIVEVGSGNSSLVVHQALRANTQDDHTYKCCHLCIEPYEMPWLERLGPDVVRKRIENVSHRLFDELEAGDILFIDSSHVIRPFGDVLAEFQSVVPKLAKGVIVHVHDIFTPRDYPEKWLRDDRRLWNEQYLLEVMLTHSTRYRTILAMNWLSHTHREAVNNAFPIMRDRSTAEPGAYWFEIAE